jgi:hypothetical protein
MFMDKRIRQARIIGLTAVVAGFVAIGLGWAGAANKACVDCQFPYLISGAAAGIGLIIFGGVMLILAQIRAERAHLVDSLERVVPAAIPAVQGVVAPRAAIANGQVVAGSASYHRPDCRLVREKHDLPVMDESVAAASGLTPCRVCHPEHAETAARSS